MNRSEYLSNLGWSDILIKHYLFDDVEDEGIILFDNEITVETIDSNQFCFEIHGYQSSSIEIIK